MAAEGEFAFVIAAFSVQEGLVDEDLYSSIVFAILLSTIIAPFSLRFTITYFNKRAMDAVAKAEEEMNNQLSGGGGVDAMLTVRAVLCFLFVAFGHDAYMHTCMNISENWSIHSFNI